MRPPTYMKKWKAAFKPIMVIGKKVKNTGYISATYSMRGTMPKHIFPRYTSVIEETTRNYSSEPS